MLERTAGAIYNGQMQRQHGTQDIERGQTKDTRHRTRTNKGHKTSNEDKQRTQDIERGQTKDTRHRTRTNKGHKT
jgi:hypothetical protein